MLAQRLFDLADFGRSRQFYEIVDDKEKFQVAVDVPGVKMEDIDVSLKDGYITISGERVVTSENSKSASKFSHTFSVDPAVDVEHFTATLNNGVLVVSAPKDLKKLENGVRKIPIAAVAATPDAIEVTHAEEKPATVKEAAKH